MGIFDRIFGAKKKAATPPPEPRGEGPLAKSCGVTPKSCSTTAPEKKDAK